MDLLKRELERKKAALKGATAAIQTEDGSRRFLKVGELRRMQEEQEAQSKRKSVDEDSNPDKRQRTGDTSSTRAGANNDDDAKNDGTIECARLQAGTASEQEQQQDSALVSSSNQAESKALSELSSADVTRELRALRLAVRLFGEDDAARHERLKQAWKDQKEKLATISDKEEFRLGRGHGIRNPFLEQDRREEDRQVPSVAGSKKGQNADKEKEPVASDKTDDDDASDPHKRIYRYFKGLLREWEEDLTLRSDEVKRSVAGKNETKTLKQCKDYIRPLFKQCKSRKLEEGLMSNLLKIIDFCQQGDFVKANDAYIDVAIGRAAWPIGVTMVGIHARTGRSKIESQNVAHVMNSELQRKYLTSVKRLMTYAQKKRTDVDPSKKVLS